MPAHQHSFVPHRLLPQLASRSLNKIHAMERNMVLTYLTMKSDSIYRTSTFAPKSMPFDILENGHKSPMRTVSLGEGYQHKKYCSLLVLQCCLGLSYYSRLLQYSSTTTSTTSSSSNNLLSPFPGYGKIPGLCIQFSGISKSRACLTI